MRSFTFGTATSRQVPKLELSLGSLRNDGLNLLRDGSLGRLRDGGAWAARSSATERRKIRSGKSCCCVLLVTKRRIVEGAESETTSLGPAFRTAEPPAAKTPIFSSTESTPNRPSAHQLWAYYPNSETAALHECNCARHCVIRCAQCFT